TGGYIGDPPPYQGHVAILDAASGKLLHVWNSLCSNRHGLIEPASCGASDSSIFGRAGAVVDQANGQILVATGNAPWDGRTNFGDAVIRLDPNATRMLGNWTPTNTEQLNVTDTDLGSTSPFILSEGYIGQGGKDGMIRVLSVKKMAGTAPHRGGELQSVFTPSGNDLFTAPAIWHRSNVTWVFAADNGGTAAWRFRNGRLSAAWRNKTGGTSPVVAGGLLWVYDPGGGLNVYAPFSGKLLHTLPATGTARSSSTAASRSPRGTRTTTPPRACSTFSGSSSARAAAPYGRRLLAECRVGERLQRLVQGCELACQLEEVLVVVETAVQLRELVTDAVEPLEQDVETAVGEILVLHASHVKDRSCCRDRTTTVSSPRTARTSSSEPTASTRRAAPTCARATSASSAGASVKTPIRTPADCSARSRALVSARGRKCTGARSSAKRRSSGRQSPSRSSSTGTAAARSSGTSSETRARRPASSSQSRQSGRVSASTASRSRAIARTARC